MCTTKGKKHETEKVLGQLAYLLTIGIDFSLIYYISIYNKHWKVITKFVNY